MSIVWHIINSWNFIWNICSIMFSLRYWYLILNGRGKYLMCKISFLSRDYIDLPMYARTHTHTHTHTHTYIFTNLLPTSIYSDMEKEKKKTLEFRDNNISRITAREKKKKVIGRKKKKKRPILSHQLKKIKRYAISWSKEQKPTTKCCNATITKGAQY